MQFHFYVTIIRVLTRAVWPGRGERQPKGTMCSPLGPGGFTAPLPLVGGEDI